MNSSWDSPLPSDAFPRLRRLLAAYGLLVLGLGLVGNGLSLATVAAYRGMRLSSRILFAALAVCDSLALALGLTRYWLRLALSLDPRHLSAAWCRGHSFLTTCAYNLAMWLLCAIAAERLALTARPQRRPARGRRTPLLAVGGLAVAAAAKNAVLLGRRYADAACLAALPLLPMPAFAWADLALGYALPYAFLIVSCAAILASLAARGRKATAGDGGSSRRGREGGGLSRRALAATKMFLVVCLVQALTGTPGILFSALLDAGATGELSAAAARLLYNGLCLLLVTNNGVNFYVYVIISASFRRAFLELVLRRSRLRRRTTRAQEANGWAEQPEPRAPREGRKEMATVTVELAIDAEPSGRLLRDAQESAL